MNAVVERIMQRVVVDPGSGCYLWEGSVGKNGYGRVYITGVKDTLVHRAMYEASVGPILDGLQLDHRCRRRDCCRPEHLEPVTSHENTTRGAALITHCANGHPYDDANTLIRNGKNGHRNCRACAREAYRAKHPNAVLRGPYRRPS